MLILIVFTFLVVFVISQMLNSKTDKHDFFAGQVFEVFDFSEIYTRLAAAQSSELEAKLIPLADSYRIQVISALKLRFNAQNLKRLSQLRRASRDVTRDTSLLDMDTRAAEIAQTVIDGAKMSLTHDSDHASGRRRRRR